MLLLLLLLLSFHCRREMWAFLNDDAVRAAIHAEPISKIGAFDECESGYDQQRSHACSLCCAEQC